MGQNLFNLMRTLLHNSKYHKLQTINVQKSASRYIIIKPQYTRDRRVDSDTIQGRWLYILHKETVIKVTKFHQVKQAKRYWGDIHYAHGTLILRNKLSQSEENLSNTI